MGELRPIFSRHALTGASSDAAVQGDALAGAGTARDTFMTLEYKPNPFARLMKRIEVLLETNPREALRQLKHVRDDKIFTKAHEKIRIDAALERALLVVQDDKKLGNAFTLSALNMPSAPTAAHPHPGLAVHPAILPHTPHPHAAPVQAF
jgi:hypothetical protein